MPLAFSKVVKQALVDHLIRDIIFFFVAANIATNGLRNGCCFAYQIIIPQCQAKWHPLRVVCCGLAPVMDLRAS
jgi:hypothetical protein